MSAGKIVIADDLDAAEMGPLVDAGFEVADHGGIAAAELPSALCGAVGLCVRSRTVVDAAVLAAAPDLRVVGRAGTGVDNIDVEEATRRGVLVLNVPDGNTNAAAEFTLALILAVARGVVPASLALREGRWQRAEHAGIELRGRHLGVVGLGRVGRLVARAGIALGMQVSAADPLVHSDVAEDLGVKLTSLRELFTHADIVSLHVPLLEETRGLIDQELLSCTRKGLCLVNVARGGIVDEGALLSALDDGRVWGAALDVFAEEPPPLDHPLVRHPRVLATPHLGASTLEARRGVARRIASQMAGFLARGDMEGAVNAAAWDSDHGEKLRPWVRLGQRLGMLARGMLGPRPAHRLVITLCGEVASLPRAAIESAVLTGFLRPVIGPRVTVVNAHLIAEERKLELTTHLRDQHQGFQGLLRLSAGEGLERTEIDGTLFGVDQPRLVRAHGFDVDAELQGSMLFVANEDRPGMIGLIGNTLGEAQLNVASMSVGRSHSIGHALSVLNVDGHVPLEVIRELDQSPYIRWARHVRVEE